MVVAVLIQGMIIVEKNLSNALRISANKYEGHA